MVIRVSRGEDGSQGSDLTPAPVARMGRALTPRHATPLARDRRRSEARV